MRSLHRKIFELNSNNKYHFIFVLVSLACLIMLKLAYLAQGLFDRIMSVSSFLAWHTMFEFFNLLVASAIFLISYYTYDQTHNLRSIVFGSTYATVGMIGLFHTLSYKGMPMFFVENVCANRATTYWILYSIITAVGYLTASHIPADLKCKYNKLPFIVVPLAISLISFYTVTYFPGVLPAMYIEGQGLTPLKIILEYVVIGIFVLAVVRYLAEYRRTKDHMVILLCMAMVISVFSRLAFTLYGSVYDIYNYLGHIFLIISNYIVFKVIFITGVQKPYMELSKAQSELKRYAENLDQLVTERTSELERINQKLMDDLEYARDIQKAMLPTSLPEINGVSFAAAYFPAERLSGDFYNVFKLDEHSVAICIGDVSGHGVPAAMLTVFVNESIEGFKKSNGDSSNLKSPSEVLNSIYVSFNRTNFKEEVYVVLLFGIYDTRTRVLKYSSGGMNVPPLIVRESGEVSELPVQGFPICKFLEFYPVNYTDYEIKLNKGDKVLFYTDGLTEAENLKGEYFSGERLKKVLSQSKDKTASMTVDSISGAVFEFIGNKELKDDITCLVMDVT